MAAAMDWYRRHQGHQRRRLQRAADSHQRLDIQGLRMVAVLTVFANHLWGWPSGGFVGVDVFFVISGFLITGNLLRTAESTGTVSFKKFYWNRIRRIVPAATVVLVLTYIAALVVFLPFRANQVGIDALYAFAFFANWHFAMQDTDYFTASEAVSPIQHFWSLSIEEQFYFVWPALIFVISVLVVRRAWTHARRMQLAGVIMGLIVVASLGWAIYQTNTAPAWAYFDTFARVWELGAGALLAIAAGTLTRIPSAVRPLLSWTGLLLIAASLFLLNDESVGFPAPWALLPVVGAALVIAAGVGVEPKYQEFLQNPWSTYIGDISYSLYLVHWPVIVILGALVDPGMTFSITVVAMSFGLAIASYHLVETPLRRGQWEKYREPSTGRAALAAAALTVVALTSFVLQPGSFDKATAPPALAAATPAAGAESAAPSWHLGPKGAALQGEIVDALKATEWPPLNPAMEAAITGPQAPPEVTRCSRLAENDPANCTWGSPTAGTKVVVVGSSIAVTYAGPLREIALNSDDKVQVRNEAMFGCPFVDAEIANDEEGEVDDCAAKKQYAIDVINTMKPDVVVIANSYKPAKRAATGQEMTGTEWGQSMRTIVEKFAGSTKKVVFLAAPPADIKISECYGKRSSTPPHCVSRVSPEWYDVAQAEQDLAQFFSSTWIDSTQWFCNPDDLCPSFVGSTPTKIDDKHMSPEYGQKITPAIDETLRQAGVY